jgi:peptide/nickel transport system substrate-binding protein
MNIWMSSAPNHQWNPSEKTPETAWEAEIDKWMQAENASQDPQKRKSDFDHVQQIAADQAPMIFLVNPNALAAVAPRVKNVTPAVLAPQVYWNAERLQVDGALVSQR